MTWLSGHIGARVSALVDGQLAPAEEEKAWNHVLGCPGCRRLVEHEGWTKHQLQLLSATTAPAPTPTGLARALYDVDAWAAVDAIERRSVRRRTAAAVVGGGAVGAAVLGLVTVAGGLPGGPQSQRPPVRPGPATILMHQAGTPAGSSTGAETRLPDLSTGWVRRSR